MYQITLNIDGMMCGMREPHPTMRCAMPFGQEGPHLRTARPGQTVISPRRSPETDLRPVIAKTGYELTGYTCAPYEKKGLFHRH